VRRAAAPLLLCLWATTAAAQDYITVEGALDDDAFYRLVACGAPPDGVCADPMVRWRPADATDLRVAITQIAPVFSAERLRAFDKALGAAIAEINASGASLRLRRVTAAANPQITLHLLDITHGQRITGTGLIALDGTPIEAALVQVWWDSDNWLTRGAIVFPRDVEAAGLRSIMLEELTQGLGLLTDIDSRWYERRSILSETSNDMIRLGAQDIIALRRHYPPQPQQGN